jgi:hypothetical protein
VLESNDYGVTEALESNGYDVTKVLESNGHRVSILGEVLNRGLQGPLECYTSVRK